MGWISVEDESPPKMGKFLAYTIFGIEIMELMSKGWDKLKEEIK